LPWERPTLTSVSDPPSWKEFTAKHREVLIITPDPQKTGRMLLKMPKDVNACVCFLIAFNLIFGALHAKGKQELACARNKLW